MRPALQRLLARPSALSFLQCLQAASPCAPRRRGASFHTGCARYRASTTAAALLSRKRKLESNVPRDMEKLVSGDATHMESKLYNDKWSARWFATKWVSLDIAIETVHALKVDSIGPLSLQSIALREPNASDLAGRIRQLQGRGISIGNSLYSRALASFAKREQHDLLRLLLECDQHPESFENQALQRTLLMKHAEAGDWQQHELILAVQRVGAVDPQVEEYNAQLRAYAAERDQVAIVKILESMRMNRIAVEVVSIRYILRSVLPSRTPGHRPDEHLPGYERRDVDLAIFILKSIMEYNSHVPVTAWREVTRRLGMVGRITDLHSLSLWLADRYNPSTRARQASVLTLARKLDSNVSLSPSHPLHPLRILFPDVRQRAIVEWSFIHGMVSYASWARDNAEMARMSTAEERRAHVLEKITRGIRFLKQLAQHGVYVKEANVRHAVYVRLVILYGPGNSNKPYNRAVRPYNPLSLEEMVRGADEAWGWPLWPNILSLKGMIMEEGVPAVENGPRMEQRVNELLKS